MAITQVEGAGSTSLIAQLTDSNNYNDTWYSAGDSSSTKTSMNIGIPLQRTNFFDPTPTGTYLLTELVVAQSIFAQIITYEMFNLGDLDISGASGTFTVGTTMPTRSTALASSEIQYGIVVAEVTTALNSAPGTFTFTYDGIDSSGSTVTGQTTSAFTPANSTTKYSAAILPLAPTHAGVYQITAAARSAGTTPSGVIRFWGCLPIDVTASLSTQNMGMTAFIDEGKYIRVPSSSTIGMFSTSATSANGSIAYIKAVKE